MRDDIGADAALVVEVEVLDGLAGREPGGPDPGLAAVGLAGRDLAFETGGQELFVGPSLGPGPFAEAFDAAQQRRGFQFPAQVGELAGAAHAAPVARS
jgi:hypothetical protein